MEYPSGLLDEMDQLIRQENRARRREQAKARAHKGRR